MRVQKVKLHSGQYEVATDTHRFKVVCAGRRWGKSVLARLMLLKMAMEDPGMYWIVAPTYGQGKDIHWIQGYKSELNPSLVKSFNESELSVTLRNGSIVTIKSAENPDRLVGVSLKGLVVDEIAKLRNWSYTWDKSLRPTLTDHEAPAIFISTPQGYNHFYELFQRGAGEHNLYKSWHFTSYDNPHIPSSEIDSARDELPIDVFTEEYLAEFMKYTGLIYKEFSADTHVHWFDHTKGDPGDYFLGMDFAVRGYTAALIGMVKPDGHIYILDEYKQDNLTAVEHGDAIKEMVNQYVDLSKLSGFADPAGWMSTQQRMVNEKPMTWSLAEEYLEMGIPIVRANNQVTPGINYVKQLFKHNKLHIHPRCIQLLDELRIYQWKDQPDSRIGEVSPDEKPRKIHDHLVDGLRYMLYSKPQPSELEQPPYTPGMPIVFPAPQIEEPEQQIEFVEENMFDV